MSTAKSQLPLARVDPGFVRWLRLPADELAALRWERTWHPVPRFYAWVIGSSLVPDVPLAVVTGNWWYWLIGSPVAVWALVFVWSVATVFASGRPAAAVHEAVAPRCAP